MTKGKKPNSRHIRHTDKRDVPCAASTGRKHDLDRSNKKVQFRGPLSQWGEHPPEVTAHALERVAK